MALSNGYDVDGSHNSSYDKNSTKTKHFDVENNIKYKKLLKLPTITDLKQYTAVFIFGLASWATAYVVAGSAVAAEGWLFGMTIVPVCGYVVGHALEKYTTLSPIVGMVLVGVAFRNLKLVQFHLHPTADAVDFHLRRIYPVIILSKGSFNWDWEYIKSNYVLVFALATLPWIVEWISLTTAVYYVIGMPWVWGVHLSSITASLSPAVVIPTVNRLRSQGLGVKSKMSQLVCCAGGLDTTFTEGIFGVINTAIFFEASDSYRIIKAVLAIFVGIAFGVLWGILLDMIPQHDDPHATTLKSLLIISGGLLLMYACALLGWGGTAGVAVMVTAGTASARWARRGWSVNSHPVAEVFRVLWLILEPMLFSLSGYYLDLSEIEAGGALRIVSCLFLALLLRLTTAILVAVAGGLSFRESLFIGVTWIPKAIVEAVLIRSGLDSLSSESSLEDKQYAKMHVHFIVIAIVFTTTLGSALTTLLGPVLLKGERKVFPEGISVTYNQEELSFQRRPEQDEKF